MVMNTWQKKIKIEPVLKICTKTKFKPQHTNLWSSLSSHLKSERKILHLFWLAFYKYNEKLMKLSLKLKSAIQSIFQLVLVLSIKSSHTVIIWTAYAARAKENRFTKLARTATTIVDQNFDPVSNVDSPKCLSNCSYCRTKFHQCGKGFSKMVISTFITYYVWISVW